MDTQKSAERIPARRSRRGAGLFIRKGIAGTTTKKWRKKRESETSIYNYFESKGTSYKLVFHGRVQARALKSIVVTGPAELSAAVRAATGFAERRPDAYRLYRDQPITRSSEDAIRQGKADGHFRRNCLAKGSRRNIFRGMDEA
jgi:hypothetical protein